MPRVAINRQKYKMTDLTKWLIIQRKIQNVNQEEAASWFGITQQAYGTKERKGQFSYSEMLILFSKLNAEDTVILKLMRI